jgi:hypothetical protein
MIPGIARPDVPAAFFELASLSSIANPGLARRGTVFGSVASLYRWIVVLNQTQHRWVMSLRGESEPGRSSGVHRSSSLCGDSQTRT